MHDLDIDGSDTNTALPDDDDDVVSFESFPKESVQPSFPVSGGSVFLCSPVQGAAPSSLGSEDGVFA